MIGIKLVLALLITTLTVVSGSFMMVKNMTASKASASVVKVTPGPTIKPSEYPLPSPSIEASSSAIPTTSPSIRPSVKPSATPTSTPVSSPTIVVTPAPTVTPQANNPKLTSIDPSDAAFSTPMTLKGEGFGSQPGIINVYNAKGEPQPYPPAYSWSDTEIKSHSPFFASDSEYQLEIQTADGRRSNRMTVKSGGGQPHVDEFSPSGAKPGDEITLKGGRFENNSGSVNFFLNYPNISGSGTIVSWSENEIKIKLPSNLEVGKEYGIQVINGRGGQSSFKFYTLGS